MSAPEFADEPPQSDRLRAYDERHLVTYLRLLDAEQDEASWQEVVSLIFAIDPASDPERARRVYDAQLARATWRTQHGYDHPLVHRTQPKRPRKTKNTPT